MVNCLSGGYNLYQFSDALGLVIKCPARVWIWEKIRLCLGSFRNWCNSDRSFVRFLSVCPSTFLFPDSNSKSVKISVSGLSLENGLSNRIQT